MSGMTQGEGGQVAKLEWLAVTALATLVAVATVDAVRGEASDPACGRGHRAARPRRGSPVGSRAVKSERASSSSTEDGCAVQLLALPSLERTQDPRRLRAAGCRSRRTAAWSHAASGRKPRCSSGTPASSCGTVPGCAPAWQPRRCPDCRRTRDAVVRFLDACPRGSGVCIRDADRPERARAGGAAASDRPRAVHGGACGCSSTGSPGSRKPELPSSSRSAWAAGSTASAP